jgi:hypothetical protein
MIFKAYIHHWEVDAPPNTDRVIYHFCKSPRDAYYWDARYLAERMLTDLNRGVTIPADGTYVCWDFQIEEDNEGRLLIWCEAPFEPPPMRAGGR